MKINQEIYLLNGMYYVCQLNRMINEKILLAPLRSDPNIEIYRGQKNQKAMTYILVKY